MIKKIAIDYNYYSLKYYLNLDKKNIIKKLKDKN